MTAAQKTFGLGLCTSGKYRYDTAPAAQRGKRAVRRRMHSARDVYRCTLCHGWHLATAGR